jgi:hypothetical protein
MARPHVAGRRERFAARQHAIGERQRAAIRREAYEELVGRLRSERDVLIDRIGGGGAAAAFGSAIAIVEDARDEEAS